MKKMAMTYVAMIALVCAGTVGAAVVTEPPNNPAQGIWIQQVGDIVPHASTRATLYYTKYAQYQKDAVKSLKYYYDGAGYLQLLQKDTICGKDNGMEGADGIVHHPDGSLIVAGQGKSVHKVNKSGGNSCVIKTSTTSEGVWHLMNDPSGKYVWAAGIPGKLHRIYIGDDAPDRFDSRGYNVTLSGKTERSNHNSMATLIWDDEGHAFFTRSDYHGGGCERYGNSNSSGVGYDFRLCTDEERRQEAAGAYFGYITDTTKVYVANAADRDRYSSYGCHAE